MKNENIDRKDFFKKVSLFGISAIGATTLLKACGGGPEEPEPAETSSAASEDECGDLSGLTDEEIQGRENLGYVAETPNPEERCNNCALWQEKRNESICGGCSIMAGPINPQGWCTAWVAG